MAGSLLFAALAPPDNVSIFDPVSPQASAIRDLAILVMAIVGFIFVVVEGTLIYSIVRFRRTNKTLASEPPQVYGSHAIEIAWTVAPALIVVILILVVARTEWEVRADPPRPREQGGIALVIAGHRRRVLEPRPGCIRRKPGAIEDRASRRRIRRHRTLHHD